MLAVIDELMTPQKITRNAGLWPGVICDGFTHAKPYGNGLSIWLLRIQLSGLGKLSCLRLNVQQGSRSG